MTLVAARRPLSSTAWASPARTAVIATSATATAAGIWPRRPSAAPASTAASSVIWASSSSAAASPAATQTAMARRATASLASSRRSKALRGAPIRGPVAHRQRRRGITRNG
jgi:hypothetical protein